MANAVLRGLFQLIIADGGFVFSDIAPDPVTKSFSFLPLVLIVVVIIIAVVLIRKFFMK